VSEQLRRDEGRRNRRAVPPKMKARLERLTDYELREQSAPFPFPVSPKTKTVESVGATFETWTSTWRNGSRNRRFPRNMDERTMSSRNATFSFRVLSRPRLRSSIVVPVAYQRTRRSSSSEGLYRSRSQ